MLLYRRYKVVRVMPWIVPCSFRSSRRIFSLLPSPTNIIGFLDKGLHLPLPSAFASSWINPIIYSVMNRAMRKKFLKMLGFRKEPEWLVQILKYWIYFHKLADSSSQLGRSVKSSHCGSIQRPAGHLLCWSRHAFLMLCLTLLVYFALPSYCNVIID